MRKNKFIVLTVIISMTISISACSPSLLGSDEEALWKKALVANGISSSITLTENTWEGGNITSDDGVQWFKFSVTVSKHFIHFISDELTSLKVQVYDSSGNKVGSQTDLSSSSSSMSLIVTTGQAYYIKVTSSSSGTYQIAFTTVPMPPGTTVITLAANTWAEGSLGSDRKEQWFKFAATTSVYQYIHVSSGSLSSSNGLYIQLYDTDGNAVGSQSHLTYNSNKYISLPVSNGQEYYIKVTPYSSSYSGTYQIAFNTMIVPPVTTTLNVNTWENGKFTSSGDEQWFKFTATTSGDQYIHVRFGTLGSSYGLYVQVYDSNGNAVGSQSHLYYSSYYNYNSIYIYVSNGQEYYIKVTPYSISYTGTYQIAFNESSTPPS